MSEWMATEFDGYVVNALGQVRGPRGKVLRSKLRGKGYPSVTVSGSRTVYVHALVCTAFHGSRPTPTHQVAHRNGVPTDNRAVNLRWATPAQNSRDAVAHGTLRLRRGGEGEANGGARLTWEQVEQVRVRFAAGQTQASLAAQFGVGKTQIHNIVREKQWAPDREEWRP